MSNPAPVDTHSTHYQIDFLARVIAAMKKAATAEKPNIEEMAIDLVGPCLQWMGWQLGPVQGTQQLRVKSGSASVVTAHEGDGAVLGATVLVHVGTKEIEFPISVRTYADEHYRYDVSSMNEVRKVEINTKNPDSCMGLIPMLAATIKSRLW